MPTIIDHAIVIRCWDFSETSQTVSLLARDNGVIRGLAKGAKRQKGHFSGGLDVLTRGEVVAIIKPNRDLATITAWHLQDMYPALRRSLAANRAGQYMADLLHHLLQEHDPHPNLFDAFDQALVSLEDAGVVEPALLSFQWKLLSETGYQPELVRDAHTGSPLSEIGPVIGFSPTAGGIVADINGSAGATWKVRRETIQMLRHAANSQLGAKPDGEALRRANRLLGAYFCHIIGSEPPTMRWAFSDVSA